MGAIAGANMWALLLDHDPGNSAAASDLAVDVVDQKLKKAAAVTTGKVRINKKASASGALVVEVANPTNLVKEAMEPVAVEDKQAANVHDVGLQINVPGDNKQTAAAATTSDGDDLTNEEIDEMLATLPRVEEAEEEKDFIDVVAKGGGRRRAVARKAAPVAEGGISGANMWALLSDEDPSSSSDADIGEEEEAEEEEAAPADNVPAGPGETKTAKRGKKTKTKKKKTKQAEEEMTDESPTRGSRFRTVAWRVCRAAVAVAMLATYFQLGSTPPVA